MTRIRVTAGPVKMLVELDDSETAKGVLAALPASASARIWGEEVYFDVPLDLPDESPRDTVPPGTVAYWKPGSAVCLFFGQKPASPVNVIGRMLGNPRDFARVKPGDAVRMEAVPEPEAED